MKTYGVIGWKNAGKTGLVERLVRELSGRGLAVSTMKHAHHAFDVDREGKDSWRHRRAGAREVLLASARRWALMHELGEGEEEPAAPALVARLSPCNLVLVEGYKRDTHPKIEVFRHTPGRSLIAPGDPSVRAIAADLPDKVRAALPEACRVEVFHLDDTAAIADFILRETGLGDAPRERPAAAPRLRDDCFALPPGVTWTPVDEALAHLRRVLVPVTGTQCVPTGAALGRVLARDHHALRANPPGANAAVDGYGFAFAALPEGDPLRLPLVDGRAAAGAPWPGAVPAGQAIRIFTGALLPEGVDTVVMQEDVRVEGDEIVLAPGIRPGANTRAAGEDVQAGALALERGQVMRPPDIALASALGLAELEVRARLRVGVLSTGDEIVEPGSTLETAATYDANRPMLLSLARAWGHDAIDLGHVADNRAALRSALDEAVGRADVILTSGGASAGDEDHVSALLREEGHLHSWRVALKPGRPLVLAQWRGVPVFGLPGNPVAALVTALIFARPALSVLAGSGWREARGFEVPAAFRKSKKAGRREYLRARLTPEGAAEVFPSEGSGRISGLSWATGLVELAEPAREIHPGDRVRYLPYEAFGI